MRIPPVLLRLAAVVNVFSAVVMIFSITMLFPLALAHYYRDAAAAAFDQTVAITFLIGLAFRLITWRMRRELQLRDGFLLVSMVWTLLPALAALPFIFYFPELSFTDAYFEATAGFTTTGSSVLSGLDGLPPSINFWRCELQWLGGMGLLILAVAILPLLGVGGMQLYKAEIPGPMKESKLTPRITETAKGLWTIYAVMTASCAVAYGLAGMNWYDAVCHAFTTLSLGGFSTHDASFAYFDSVAIEVIAMIFMLIAGINFATHFLAWRGRGFAPYRQDPEAGMFVLVVLGSSLAVALYLWHNAIYSDWISALRYGIFNTVSMATTTGYVTDDFSLWPIFASLWILFLGCFASSSGSTGGGIKMIRAELLVRQGLRELLKAIHPSAQVPVKFGGHIVANQIVFAVLAFMSIYGASVLAMTFLLLVTGLDFVTGFTAIVASINNMGPGLGLVGPATNFAVLNDFQTWVCSAAMLLGRLELVTLIVIFTPAFWRR